MHSLDQFLKRAALFGSFVGGTTAAISAAVIAVQSVQISEFLQKQNSSLENITDLLGPRR